MNRIIRWYNQNRRIIWTVIAIVIGIVFLIRTVNSYYKNNTKEESSSTNISTTTYNNPNYSVVSQKKIDETTSKKSIDLIKKFFDFCNNGKIEEAYNLLSDDCKQKLYPNIEDFKERYYTRIFTESKIYNSSLWISKGNKNTYRLEIMGDILATGNKENMPIEDYYTVIFEDGKYSLSISNYIGKEEINISKTYEGITITIFNKHMYMDYEIYEVKVENNSHKNIILNTKEDTDSMYIQDENELKHIAFLNEISEYDLNIGSALTKTYNIKFNRGYKPNIYIEKIVFEDIKLGQAEDNISIELNFN